MAAGRKNTKKDEIDIAEMMRRTAEQISQHAAKPNILGYTPHHKQLLFHMATDHIRCYIGGNRSGKTYSAVVEDIWWCSKTHPYKKMPPGPVRGRVVAVDFKDGVDQILVPLFKSLMVPSMLVNGNWEDSYSDSKHLLTFSNGSFIEFMSYEQSVEKFAGTSRHFVHYDEEPPKDIYNECQARLVDTEGDSWISMTPINGATWVFDDLYEPAVESPDKKIIIEATMDIGQVFSSEEFEITVIEVGMNENPHISEKARNRFLKSLTDDDERKARSKGTFLTLGGKVFKTFSVETHEHTDIVIPRQLQLQGWQIYTSVDHGWANPTAWLWHAVAPAHLGGRIITFGEHYKSEMTISEHAQVVNLKEQTWGLDVDEIMRTGDPAMHQTSAHTGTSAVTEYAKYGIAIGTSNVSRDRDIGIKIMQEYLKVPKNGQPLWKITSDCPNFIRELKKLKKATHATSRSRTINNLQEGIVKKDDHAFDSAKYFATFLPELAPEIDLYSLKPVRAESGTMSYDEALTLGLRNAEEKRAQYSGWDIDESY